MTFETLPIKGLIEEESSSQVTQTTATPEAQLNANNQETIFHIEYANR